jgi:hypothetical protein
VYGPFHPDFSEGAPAPNQIAYFGEDTSKWSAMSPLNHVRPGHPRMFLSVTEFDPYPLSWPTSALLSALVKCDKGMNAWFRLQRDHNHVSPAMQINSSVDTLGPELLEYIASA